jgi:hypothetical protein
MYGQCDCSACQLIMIIRDPKGINTRENRRECEGSKREKQIHHDLEYHYWHPPARLKRCTALTPFHILRQQPTQPSPTMSTGKHNITLYCESTPNPLKISIALEELGLKYNVQIPPPPQIPP